MYNSYNTRQSGRFNTPGRFVSGGELAPGGEVGFGRGNRGHNNGMNNQYRNNQHRQGQSQHQGEQYQQQQYQPQQQPQQQQQQAPPPPPFQPETQEQAGTGVGEQSGATQEGDIDMKFDSAQSTRTTNTPDTNKPHWMKSKLNGVKKITNRERRRRQNENLRRLLAPKNALMVLNEMLPGEREQFKVEPAPPLPYYNTPNSRSFCAQISVEGVTYRGYGENKMAARNDAAEQAIRDLIIKRMSKGDPPVLQSVGGEAVAGGGAGAEAGESAAGGAGGEHEQTLPMIQLASFALHKLFAEWECEGHKVPMLKAAAVAQLGGDGGSEAGGEGARGGGRGARALPAGAAAMHPCMLLTYMRPHLEYYELAVDGDRPQNMLFTMGIDVDGVTYSGQATNKREARKQAARAACAALFGVTFTGAPTAPGAPAAPAAAAAAAPAPAATGAPAGAAAPPVKNEA